MQQGRFQNNGLSSRDWWCEANHRQNIRLHRVERSVSVHDGRKAFWEGLCIPMMHGSMISNSNRILSLLKYVSYFILMGRSWRGGLRESEGDKCMITISVSYNLSNASQTIRHGRQCTILQFPHLDGQPKSRPARLPRQAWLLEQKYHFLAFRWMTCLACGGETLKLSM
jgi:hypothetical protein